MTHPPAFSYPVWVFKNKNYDKSKKSSSDERINRKQNIILNLPTKKNHYYLQVRLISGISMFLHRWKIINKDIWNQSQMLQNLLSKETYLVRFLGSQIQIVISALSNNFGIMESHYMNCFNTNIKLFSFEFKKKKQVGIKCQNLPIVSSMERYQFLKELAYLNTEKCFKICNIHILTTNFKFTQIY